MTFYERYTMLCEERGIKPQTKSILEYLEIKSPTVTAWKNGSSPKTETICKLSRYFNVTSDFLLGLNEFRNPLSEEEQLLVNAYRSAKPEGRFRIIQTCMNEQDKGKASEAI